MRGLRSLLALQLAFFAIWGGYLLTSHRNAEKLWLATEPIDPRDFLSGHYVALRYPIARIEGGACAFLKDEPTGERIFVKLAPGSNQIGTLVGPATISEAVLCQTFPPNAAAGEVWLAGDLAPGRGLGPEIVFGIERFYVPETSPLREAQSGTVVAQVAINDDYQARIVDLVPISSGAP
jgi:uncharacterized membrane-anchored protein